jgi:hypothetical protein
MRGPRGAGQSVRARISHLAADISYTQRRFAELNRPWVARRGDDPNNSISYLTI